MEDAPIAHTNIVMPLVDEDANESQHSHSRDHSYPPAPDSPNDMPLLADGQDDVDDHDASPDLLRAPPGEGMPTRPSTDTLNTSTETGIVSDMGPTATSVDPRGEAPPYFEVVDLNDDSQRNLIDVRPELATSPPSNPSTSPEPPSTGGSGASSAPRRSTFFSMKEVTAEQLAASAMTQWQYDCELSETNSECERD